MRSVQRSSPTPRLLGASTLAAATVACNAILGSTAPTAPVAEDAGADATVDADAAVDADAGAEAGAGADGSRDAAPLDAAPEADGAQASCSPPAWLSCDGTCVTPTWGPSTRACDAGADAAGCAPTLLVGSPNADHGLWALYGIAVAGDTLYGTDYYKQPYTAVFKASTTSYTADPHGIYPPPGDAGINGSAADTLVTDGSRLYFVSYQDLNSDLRGGIYSLDMQGNGGPIAFNQGVSCLALDTDHVYWGTPSGDFWRADRDGGHAIETHLPQWTSARFVVKGGRLYYSAEGAGGLVAADPAAPASVLTHYSGTTHANEFDVGSTFVFWADVANQAIYRALIDCPGTPENITPPGFTFERSALSMRTDDQWVYVINSDIGPPGGATISRFHPDGSALEVMATLDDAVSGLDQDSTALYFGTYGAGQLHAPPYPAVWKLTK